MDQLIETMRVYNHISELIGQTPMIRLGTGLPTNGPDVFVKLEYYNPTGSLKDRMTYHIIKAAMDDGRLSPGDTVIDNTSGNTGSSLAMVASIMGLKAIVVTPEKTSREKIDLIKSYGAKVIVTPEVDHHDPVSFYSVARRLAHEHGYFDLNQYHSQANVEAHYLSTGPEIWNDTEGRITHFVAGIGTGGTLSGVAQYLKEKNPRIKIIAVDPEGSVFTEYINNDLEVQGHTYSVEGIGSDVITGAFHKHLVDQVITVGDREAFIRAREITRAEGISAGGSSGAVAVALEQVAKEADKDSIIVGIFGDAGIRYLTKMYNDTWMQEHGFLENEEQTVKT